MSINSSPLRYRLIVGLAFLLAGFLRPLFGYPVASIKRLSDVTLDEGTLVVLGTIEKADVLLPPSGVELAPTHSIAFLPAQVLFGDPGQEGKLISIAIDSIAGRWPKSIIPLEKGSRCILVLHRDSGNSYESLMSVIPITSPSYLRPKNKTQLKELLREALMVQIRNQLAEAEMAAGQGRPLMTEADIKEIESLIEMIKMSLQYDLPTKNDNSVATFWQTLLIAIKSGDEVAIRALCTPTGFQSLKMGIDPSRPISAQWAARGIVWSNSEIRWQTIASDSARAYLGPSIKEASLEFRLTVDGWRFHRWSKGA